MATYYPSPHGAFYNPPSPRSRSVARTVMECTLAGWGRDHGKNRCHVREAADHA